MEYDDRIIPSNMSTLPSVLKRQVMSDRRGRYYHVRKVVTTIAVAMLCSTLLLFSSCASAHTVLSEEESLLLLLQQQQHQGQTPPPIPQGRDLSFNSENDDDDDDDPYRMVRVVVTIQNSQGTTTTSSKTDQWNAAAVKATSSSSSSSSNSANEPEPIPWLPQSTIGGSTTTTTTNPPFVPEPWIEEHYEDARAVSQIKRIKDPTTTSIVTFDIPQYRILDLESDPRITSVIKDTLVYPMQPVTIRRTLHLRRQQEEQQREIQSVPSITSTLTSTDALSGQEEIDCPIIASGDKICLAQRGIVSSYEKALTCQRSGGIGLIIYDDVEGYVPFTGTLNITAEWINIPVVGITKRDGEALVALTNTAASTRITLNMVDSGYEEISGTSMAVPFVSGIAAKIWYLRPQCSAEQVRLALYSSAKKLFSGISVEMDQWYFGNGLVQAEGAYHALLQMPYPCGEVTSTTSTSTPNGLTNNNTTNSTSPPVTMTSGNATYSGNNTGYQYNINDWWRRLWSN